MQVFAVEWGTTKSINGGSKDMPYCADDVDLGVQIEVGDYFKLGRYYNEPILWRCIDIDENGPLMLSDRILSLKAFDAKGSNSGENNDSSHTRGTNSYHKRQNRGSNFWADSNIRDWLNSTADAGKVYFSCGNMPNDEGVYNGLNSYENESGFLSADNFSTYELKYIKQVTQKVVLNELDAQYATSGTTYHVQNPEIKNCIQNYNTTAYTMETTDQMFFLNCEQLYQLYCNFKDEGTRYWLAYPTQAAIDHSEYKGQNLSTDKVWFYWLRDAHGDGGSPTHPRHVGESGVYFSWAYNDLQVGIRPAFYLNTDNVTNESDYLVDVFTSYDEEKKQAVFGLNPDIYTYQVTDKTDLSFVDQLDKLLGQRVLVCYTSGKYGEDNLTRYILSIMPANIQTGMVEAITESSVTINGKTYSADFEGWVGLDSYIEQTVVCYFNNDVAVDVKVLEKKTGVLSAGSNTTVTIDDVHYPAIFKGIPPFLAAPDLWFGNSVNYWIADNIVYQVELPDYNSTYYKRLDRIEGKKAYFHDGSQYEIAKDTSVDANMIGRWVKISLITSAETGTNLVDMQLLRPKVSVKVEMDEKRNIRLENNKYSYDGKNPVPSSQFEIVYRIIVSNTIPHDSEEDLKLMKSDPTLTIAFENLEVTPPENFNAGWLGSGEIPNVSGTILSPGETKEGKGYVRPGMLFFVDDNDVSVTKDIQINLQTTAGEYSGETSFTILNLNYKPPKPKKDVFNDATVKLLGKKAANELDALYDGSSSGIVLDINTMSQIFGIKGQKLELFEKELLTEVIMSSAPEDSLSEQISDSLMSDIFGDFKSPVSGKSYDVPLEYVVETPDYGILTVKFNSRVTSFTLNQSRYTLMATVTYEVLQQDNSDEGRSIPDALKRGTLGGISYSDVKAFTDAAYALAKEALKEAYDDAWGKSADQVASFLFGDIVNYILEKCDTSFSNVLWDIMIRPTENMRIACPVDLFIYDQDGTLCGSIENNTVTQTNPEIQLFVEGDIKYINGLKGNYTVGYKATDNGDMDIVITEFSEYESPLRTITFQSVPLAKDGTYTQNIIGEVFTTPENYRLTSNSGEEVMPDDEVVFVDFESDETTTDPDLGDGDGDNSGGGSGGGSSSPTYSITSEDTDGGTITISPKTASKDKIVTITTVSDEGYKLDTLSVSDKNGNPIEFTKKTDTEYTFKMPASKVTVNATFSKVIAAPEPSSMLLTDVSENAWYYNAVKYVYENGMMQGISNIEFAPTEAMNRAMIVTVLHRLENTPETTSTNQFADVESNQWYTDSVQWAFENDIVNGYSSDKFAPMDNVTREQIAVILYNYTNYKGGNTDIVGDLTAFKDADDISDWSKNAISWAIGSGLLSGKGNGILDPKGTATRAEVAQILMNYCIKVI